MPTTRKRLVCIVLASLTAGAVLLALGAAAVGPGWPQAIAETIERLGGPSASAAAPISPKASSATQPNEEVITENGQPTAVKVDGETYPVRVYKPLAANDPYANQWWTSQTGLSASWDIPAGATASTVAVIDGGYALQHEDLVGRWQRNLGEQGATQQQAATGQNCTARSLPIDKSCNLIDDDNNGYIDDVQGWDFSNNDNDTQTGTTAPTGAGVGHGTMVAGVLAASGNNAKGMAGVDWTARILPLQAMNDVEYGTSLTVARAVRYAADRNADVINISLGTSEPDPYLRLAIQYALDAGTLVVAASGNDGCDCISYPARYPEVVAVGASRSDNNPATFSSYGDQLDILAPGNAMTTTTWSSANPTAAYATNVAGTSFAAPFVSGMLSRARNLHPDITWAEAMAVMRGEADRTGLTVAQPTTSKRGGGIVKAGAYVTRLTTVSRPNSRQYFQPLSGSHQLASQRVYQCGESEISTVRVTELQQGGNARYTVNPLEKVRALDAGWTQAREWPACIDLPFDFPGEARSVNLFAEIRNEAGSKQGTIPIVMSPRGQPLYVNPAMVAAGRPSQITSQPIATWFGDWTSDVQTAADNLLDGAEASGKLASLVAYNIPARDCGQYSAGGAGSSAGYRQWIDKLAAGIGKRQAIVVVEPDAIAQMDCLSPADQAQRYADLSYVVDMLTSRTNAFVYLDAGHSEWHSVAEITSRLQKANVANARGFSLNVSNFQTTNDSTAYGTQIASNLNKSFIIDTSRNGKGAIPQEWCNPAGRALGASPTTSVNASIDAYLWVKYPGESDGTCNGGPAAGQWWHNYALELIANAGS